MLTVDRTMKAIVLCHVSTCIPCSSSGQLLGESVCCLRAQLQQCNLINTYGLAVILCYIQQAIRHHHPTAELQADSPMAVLIYQIAHPHTVCGAQYMVCRFQKSLIICRDSNITCMRSLLLPCLIQI